MVEQQVTLYLMFAAIGVCLAVLLYIVFNVKAKQQRMNDYLEKISEAISDGKSKSE